jgi:hypothetical protein
VAGCLFGLLVRQRFPVRFKDEIDVVPLIQLGVTLIIALLITHYAKQRADERRVEKEIIIEQLRDCQAKGKEIFGVFSACCDEGRAGNEEQRKLKREMREFSNLLSTAGKAIEYSGNQLKLAQRWRAAQQLYFAFKAEITNIDPAADLTNPNFRNRAQTAWRELEDELLRLIFEINKI